MPVKDKIKVKKIRQGVKAKFIPKPAESPEVIAARWAKKKDAIHKLANDISTLRSNVSKDLKATEDEKTFLTALIIAIIDKTGERIGNDDSAKIGHHGVSGFKKSHVKIAGNRVTLKYKGKSGVEHEKTFKSEKIANGLKRAMKYSSSGRVFETRAGQWIGSDQVNRYLEPYDVSAKALRGFYVNKALTEKLQSTAIPETEKERKKLFNATAKKVAADVGHGCGTCKKHYIVPELPEQYIAHGKIIDLKTQKYYKSGGKINSVKEVVETNEVKRKDPKAVAALLAPNGKPSNLTPEQYRLVRTPEFLKWFGDWINDPKNSSKVLDENGEPLVVYHGTDKKFNVFDNCKADVGFHFGTKEQAEIRLYDTKSKKQIFLELFLNIKNPLRLGDAVAWHLASTLIQELNDLPGIETFKLELPGVENDYIDTEDDVNKNKFYINKMRNFINENGYDGIVYENTEERNEVSKRARIFKDSYIAFYSNQIKLADGTNKTFDGSNPDIRYEKGGLLAPNGKKSNLTPEQWHLVRTPEFIKWFGDWINDPENASKVLDENGEPMVVWHGTDKEFNVFDETRAGELETIEGVDRKIGIYFSNKKSIARFFTKNKGKILSYFLSIKNPYKTKSRELSTFNIKFNKELGNDGVIWNRGSGTYINGKEYPLQKDEIAEMEYVVFESTQIKLADGTNKAFDGSNPDIRYEKGGLLAPNGKPSNLTPEQYRLVRTPEFIKWFGDWINDPENASKVLDENGEPMVCYHGGNIKHGEFRLNPERKMIWTSPDKDIAELFGHKVIGLFINSSALLKFDKPRYTIDDFEGILFKEKIKISFAELEDQLLGRGIDDDNKLTVGQLIEGRGFAPKIQAAGFDGIMFYDVSEVDNLGLFPAVVVFSSTQIKLADGTNTTFDGSNPDIRMAKGGKYSSILNVMQINPPQVIPNHSLHGSDGYIRDPKENIISLLQRIGYKKVIKNDGGEILNGVILNQDMIFYHASNKKRKWIKPIFLRKLYDEIPPPYKMEAFSPEYDEWIFKQMRQQAKEHYNDASPVANLGDDRQGGPYGKWMHEVIVPKGTKIYAGMDEWNHIIVFEPVKVLRIFPNDIYRESTFSEIKKHIESFKGKGTNTTFDGGNPDIRYENGGEVKFSVDRIDDKWWVVAQAKEYPASNSFEKTGMPNEHTQFYKEILGNTWNEKFDSKGDAELVADSLSLKFSNRYKDIGYEKGGITDSESFKKWFGDSKVVDKEGNPLEVYHGTATEFTEFRKDKINKNFGSRFNDGFYFTEQKNAAEHYAKKLSNNGNGLVLSVYLRILHPLIVNDVPSYRVVLEKEKNRRGTNAMERDLLLRKSDTEILQEMGYDGVIFMFNGYMAEIVVFNPSQIKLADGSNTTFDASNPDIRYEKGGEIRQFINVPEINYEYHLANNLEHHSLYNKIKNKDEKDSIKILLDGFSKDVNERVEFVGNKVRLYRAVAIPGIESLKNNLGIFWAYSEDNAQVIDDEDYEHDQKPDRSKAIVLKAKFNASDIDWTKTFDLYLMNNWMEGELRVKKGSVASNVFYKNSGEEKWIPLDKDKYHAENGGVLRCGSGGGTSSQSEMDEYLRGARARQAEHDSRIQKMLETEKPSYEVVGTYDTRDEAEDVAGDNMATKETVDGLWQVLKRKGSISDARHEKGGKTNGFKKWFGDSKAVDADGNPLKVYHGTDAEVLTVFDRSKTSANVSKLGFFFTDDREFAKMFGDNIKEVYLSIQNPFVISQDKWNDIRLGHAKDEGYFAGWRKKLIDKGYDGLYAEESFEEFAGHKMRNPKIFIAFHPEQIKLADNKTFDPTNPDIRYEKGGKAKAKFDIDDDGEGRITISINNIGSVVLTETYPKYEFQDDFTEEEFEKIGLDEDDMIGKIEHIEINDAFKGKGYARLLMQKAIQVAKKRGLVPIYLNASPMGSRGLNINDLTAFYEKFGFKVFKEMGNNNLMLLSNSDIRYENGGLIEKEIKISDILEENKDGQKLSDAIINVKDGLVSQTEGNILVREINGKYEVSDGFYRLAKAVIDGKKTIKADIINPDIRFEKGGKTKSITAYHTANKPLNRIGDKPMWFTKTLKNAKAYHSNTTDPSGGGHDKAFTYEVEISGNIISESNLKKMIGNDEYQDLISTLTANPSVSEIREVISPFIGKLDGIEHWDYDPNDSGKDTTSILIFDPSKTVVLKKRMMDAGGSAETSDSLNKSNPDIRYEKGGNIGLRKLKYTPYPYLDYESKIIFVSPDKILEKFGKDNEGLDVRIERNQIDDRVEKAKLFLIEQLKLQYKDVFPSLVRYDEKGKLKISDGRHRILSAKELGFNEVAIQIPTEQVQRFEKEFGSNPDIRYEKGGIPNRYKEMGFTRVGQKKRSIRSEKKWMVLAKKGDKYRVVHGGQKGMEDFSQHHDKERQKRFWNRMGGFDSEKARDPFSPLYWHKRFGTWEEGGLIEGNTFKKWFGNSKVVHADGNPRIVYHGTGSRFNKFNIKKTTQGIFWFTSSKEDIEKGEVGAQGKGHIMELYASIQNPAGWDEYSKYGLGQLKSLGYDGAILPEKDGSFVGFVFDPTRLKSATSNRGTFDGSDSDIRHSDGGPVENDDFVDSEKNRIFIPTKLTKDELQSIISGKSKVSNGDAIQATLIYIRRNERTSETGKATKPDLRLEEEQLKKFISENNLWYTERLDDSNYVDRGAEHLVYKGLHSGRFVIKTNNFIFYNSWPEYLISLLLHNSFFPDTSYELIGFKRTERGNILPVVRQRFIEKNHPTNLKDVELFLLDKGFIRFHPDFNVYENKELEVTVGDLHEGNVLTKDDNLYFIDTKFYLSPIADYAYNIGGNIDAFTSSDTKHSSGGPVEIPAPMFHKGERMQLKGYADMVVYDVFWLQSNAVERPVYQYQLKFVGEEKPKNPKVRLHYERDGLFLYEWELPLMLKSTDTGIDYIKSYKKFLGDKPSLFLLDYQQFIMAINKSLYYSRHPEHGHQDEVQFYLDYKVDSDNKNLATGGKIKFYTQSGGLANPDDKSEKYRNAVALAKANGMSQECIELVTWWSMIGYAYYYSLGYKQPPITEKGKKWLRILYEASLQFSYGIVRGFDFDNMIFIDSNSEVSTGLIEQNLWKEIARNYVDDVFEANQIILKKPLKVYKNYTKEQFIVGKETAWYSFSKAYNIYGGNFGDYYIAYELPVGFKVLDTYGLADKDEVLINGKYLTDDMIIEYDPRKKLAEGGKVSADQDGLAFKKMSDNLFLVTSDTQEKLAKLFIRPNSYLDSKEFKGKIFTLDQFKDWYTKEKGAFTYYQDYKGFNIPDSVIDVFQNGSFDPLSQEEKWLMDNLKSAAPEKPYYVIGYVHVHGEEETRHHELAHALYYLSDTYRNEVNDVIEKFWKDISPKALSTIQGFLTKLQYDRSIWNDEMNAYLIADKDYLVGEKAWSEEFDKYRKTLGKIFEINYYKTFKKEFKNGLDERHSAGGLIKPSAQNQIDEYIKEGIFITKEDKPIAGFLPLSRFNGSDADIYPNQLSVDRNGVEKWKKRIAAGERPSILIDHSDFLGENRVKDGHHRLKAYEDLGIENIPVIDVNGKILNAGRILAGGMVDGDYKKWKRKNVTYRGMKEALVENESRQPSNNVYGSLGNGLYTASLSNKSMAKEYGTLYFVVNGRPKNPKKFNGLNEWEIWFYNNLVSGYSKAKGKDYPDKRDFMASTTIEAEVQKLGYDGIEIVGREIVNFSPGNDVRYFRTEDELKRYYDQNISNMEAGGKMAKNDIYIYHGTGKGQALNMQRDGFMKPNRTGEEHPSISFTNSMDYAKYYAKSKGGSDRAVILRTELDDSFKLSPRIIKNKGAEYVTFENVPASKLEMLSSDGSWKPLDKWNVIFDEPLEEKMADGGITPSDKVLSASSRFRPSETIVFDKPIIGPSGAQLVSYEWKWQPETYIDREGEDKVKRVSDWMQAESSADTGRGIVHQFSIRLPNGEVKTVSSESVPILLGYTERERMKSFPSLANAVKTLAKQKMKLAIMEEQQKEFEAAKEKFTKSEKPEIKSEPVFDKEGNQWATKWKMGESFVLEHKRLQDKRSDIDTIPSERKECLIDAWTRENIAKTGAKQPYGLRDQKDRIARQERRVAELSQSDMKYSAGGEVEGKKKKIIFYHGVKRMEDVDKILKEGFKLSHIKPLWQNDYAISVVKSPAAVRKFFGRQDVPIIKMEFEGTIVPGSEVRWIMASSAQDYTRKVVEDGIDAVSLEGGFGQSFIYNPKAIKKMSLLEPSAKKEDGGIVQNEQKAKEMAELFMKSLSKEDLKSLKDKFSNIMADIQIKEEEKLTDLSDRKSVLEKQSNELYEKEKGLPYGDEKEKLGEERRKIRRAIASLDLESRHQQNIVKAISEGGELVTFTDKKEIEHKGLPYFVRIKTDIISFDEDTILTEKMPSYMPFIDEEVFARKGYVFDAIRIAIDQYILAVNGYHEMKGGKSEYRMEQDTNPYHPSDSEQGYVIVSLDQLALINDYYFTKAKALERKKADDSDIRTEKYYDSLTEERRSFLDQKGYYRALPNAVKKKITQPEYEALSLVEKEKLYKPFKRASVKRLVSKLSENTMWTSFHEMYERFMNPAAVPITKDGSPIKPGQKRGSIFGTFGNPETFKYWYDFSDMMKWKMKDIQVQRQMESEVRKIALETSFGESNTNDTLREKYGILVKRQNGTKILPAEIDQIRDAWIRMENTFGTLSHNARNENLKISHTGIRFVFASKAAGTFIPDMKTIAVSAKFGDNQFADTMAHEVAHWIDYGIGHLKGKRYATDDFESTAGIIARTFRRLMNKKSDSDYTNATKECFARAMEQYFAFENFGEEATLMQSINKVDSIREYHSEEDYVSKDNFSKEIKPLIKQFLSEQESFFKYSVEVESPGTMAKGGKINKEKLLDIVGSSVKEFADKSQSEYSDELKTKNKKNINSYVTTKEKLDHAHQEEADRVKSKVFNFGWVRNGNEIMSKTYHGFLESKINKKTGEVTHKWFDPETGEKEIKMSSGGIVGGNYQFKNDFGSFTSVKLMPVDENFIKSDDFFTVEIKVRKKEGEHTHIQTKYKTFPISRYEEYISDLKRRSEKMAEGGMVFNENLSYLLKDKGQTIHIGEEKGSRVQNGISIYKNDLGSYRYVKYIDGIPVAAIQVMSRDGRNGYVSNAYTSEKHRRHGHGIDIINKIKGDFKNITLSEDLSGSGRAFKESVLNAKHKRNRWLGKDVATGKKITIDYIKNPEKAPYFGSRYGQDVEPAGFYITQNDGFVPKGWKSGTVTFGNPLVIDVDDNTLVSYKYKLSERFGNKKGKSLTDELQKKGYDGIITRHDHGHLEEIIAFKNAVVNEDK